MLARGCPAKTEKCVPGGKMRSVTKDRQRFIAHGLVERDGAFLVLRRRDGRYFGGQWDIPGGTVEAGETPAVAAARECLEETGLRATVGPKLSHFQNRDTEGGDLTFNTVTFRLHLVDEDTEVRLSPEEHDDYRWMQPTNPDGLPLVWHVGRTLGVLTLHQQR